MLRRDYWACGCDDGARVMMVATGLVAAGILGDLIGRLRIAWTPLGIGIVAVGIFVAAGIGRAFGLAKARR